MQERKEKKKYKKKKNFKINIIFNEKRRSIRENNRKSIWKLLSEEKLK